jgi:coatomer protein complex subunit epsilon
MSIFELETNYVLGNYQGAINVNNQIRSKNEEDLLLRDYFVFRSHAELGDYRLVLDEIRANSHIALLAVQLYAAYLLNPGNEKIFATIQSWIDSGDLRNELAKVVVGCIFFRAGKYEECLRVLHDSNSLEGRAILVQLYLTINRLEYAQKEFKIMQSIKDDAPLTQLTFAWICLQDKSTCKEAGEIFHDLMNKYGSTVLLLNGLAVSALTLADFDRAEKVLLDALMIDNKSIVTRTNLVVVGQLQDKPADKLKRDLSQISSAAPDNPWILGLNKASSDFDAAQSKFIHNI